MKKVALYNPYLETKGGGEKVCLALAASLQHDLGCEVYLITGSGINLDELADYFKLNLEGIQVIPVNSETFSTRLAGRLRLPGRIKNIIFDRKLSRAVKKGNFDLFINNCYQSNLPSPTKLGVYMCMFPQRLDASQPDISMLKKVYVLCAKTLHRLVLHPAHRSPIDTYQLITANSAYTQSYIKKLWGKDSRIIFPVCENMRSAQPVTKERIILHVGRFFENVGENHHKRQDFLLETFAGMKQLHADGWQLHFAGSVAEDVGALKYLLRLIKDSQGLPVQFHFNTSFEELKTLYNQATIYWHATGFGSDLVKHPEKQEHFGIVTVEAMSAGCVPIVFNSAGQKESVIPGKNGFLWDTPKQLVEQTYLVSKMSPAERRKLIQNAQEDAKQFDDVAFRKNVAATFGDLLT